MSVEENKAIVRRWIDEGMNKRNLTTVTESLDRKYGFHAPGMEVSGIEGFKQLNSIWFEAFPDMHMAIEDMVAEADKVVMRYVLTGTHMAELKGVAATGKKVTFSGIWIIRLERGKIAETWEDSDALGLMQQLGAVSSPK